MSATRFVDPEGSQPDPEGYRAACREVDAAVRNLRIRLALVRWRFRAAAMQRARRWLSDAKGREPRR